MSNLEEYAKWFWGNMNMTIAKHNYETQYRKDNKSLIFPMKKTILDDNWKSICLEI